MFVKFERTFTCLIIPKFPTHSTLVLSWLPNTSNSLSTGHTNDSTLAVLTAVTVETESKRAMLWFTAAYCLISLVASLSKMPVSTRLNLNFLSLSAVSCDNVSVICLFLSLVSNNFAYFSVRAIIPSFVSGVVHFRWRCECDPYLKQLQISNSPRVCAFDSMPLSMIDLDYILDPGCILWYRSRWLVSIPVPPVLNNGLSLR